VQVLHGPLLSLHGPVQGPYNALGPGDVALHRDELVGLQAGEEGEASLSGHREPPVLHLTSQRLRMPNGPVLRDLSLQNR
jgi:hypothetical protein